MSDYNYILSNNGISKTKFRTDLLNLFYESNKSLSIFLTLFSTEG